MAADKLSQKMKGVGGTLTGVALIGCTINATDTDAPAVISGGSATAQPLRVKLKWTNPTDQDFSHVEIYRHTANDSSAASVIAKVKADIYRDTDGTIGTTYYYWAKTVDVNGNKSAFVAIGNAAPAQVVLATDISGAGTLAAKSTVDTLTDVTATTASSGVAVLTLTSTSADATYGPLFSLDRVSATPAANDYLGAIVWSGRNASAQFKYFGEMRVRLVTATAGAETSQLEFTIKKAAISDPTLAGFFGPTGGFVVSNSSSTADSGTGTVNVTAGYYQNAGVFWSSGAGSPEGAVTAPVGSLYSRTNGGAGTSLYVKESGAGNTGWVGK